MVGPADGPETLRSGDYISYSSDQPHTFRALVKGTAAVLIQEHT